MSGIGAGAGLSDFLGTNKQHLLVDGRGLYKEGSILVIDRYRCIYRFRPPQSPSFVKDISNTHSPTEQGKARLFI